MYLLFFITIVAVIGFERDQYIIDEYDGSLEVCSIIHHPSSTESLILFEIFLVYELSNESAG